MEGFQFKSQKCPLKYVSNMEMIAGNFYKTIVNSVAVCGQFLEIDCEQHGLKNP